MFYYKFQDFLGPCYTFAMFFVYILLCRDGTFYIGKTSDLKKRLKKHNGLLPGGGKYTRSRRPVIVHYYELYFSNSQALKREYSLKQLTKKQKETMIKNFSVCFL